TAALLLAIFWTLRAAVRAADATAVPGRRIWIIALTGAFIAVCGEELTDVALHKPGLPAIALTVWACLWAMVRAEGMERGSDEATKGDACESSTRRCSAPGFRVAGGCATRAVTRIAAGLAMVGATGLRASFEADRLAQSNKPGERQAPIALADRAARWRLDPERYLFAGMFAIQYRHWAANALAESSDTAD